MSYMSEVFSRYFYSKQIAAMAMPVSAWVVVLFLIQQSAAQPALNVWRSNGPNAEIAAVTVDPVIRTLSMQEERALILKQRVCTKVLITVLVGVREPYFPATRRFGN